MKKLVTALTATAAISAYGLSDDASAKSYTVQPGDSLWKIGNDNNLTVDQLKQYNNLSSDLILANQTLELEEEKEKETITYKVKSGDTLWGIALKNNVTVDELKEWNNLSADLILVNQELAIGESAEEQASVPEVQTPAQALEPAAETETEVEEEPAVEVPAATEVEVQETEEAEAVEVEAEEEPVEAESEEEVEEEAPAADTVADTYTVQPGDTIGGVASEFGMSYRTLMSLNGITDHL